MNDAPSGPGTTQIEADAALTRLPAVEADIALAAYNQNFETFRALNALMWQIPLIAMTLTGGLWFGVAKVEGPPIFRVGLLMLAMLGNLGLIVVLARLRYIIGRYLTWLEEASPRCHVSAPGESRWTRNQTVKLVFQLMLGFAGLISFVLMCASMATIFKPTGEAALTRAVAYYDAHAESLADGYEDLDAAATHPELFAMAAARKGMTILDVGAGTGRDAAALAALGHAVTAVEPSDRMATLARALHPGGGVELFSDAMPGLASLGARTFDLVVVSAVWMHLPPADRPRAFARLAGLTARRGVIYLTLRIGPPDALRGIFPVDVEEVGRLAAVNGLVMRNLGRSTDLLGRRDVHWEALILSR
jgi:SAM-dependent methyltransferase